MRASERPLRAPWSATAIMLMSCLSRGLRRAGVPCRSFSTILPSMTPYPGPSRGHSLRSRVHGWVGLEAVSAPLRYWAGMLASSRLLELPLLRAVPEILAAAVVVSSSTGSAGCRLALSRAFSARYAVAARCRRSSIRCLRSRDQMLTLSALVWPRLRRSPMSPAFRGSTGTSREPSRCNYASVQAPGR